jgi:hypothetical protein
VSRSEILRFEQRAYPLIHPLANGVERLSREVAAMGLTIRNEPCSIIDTSPQSSVPAAQSRSLLCGESENEKRKPVIYSPMLRSDPR